MLIAWSVVVVVALAPDVVFVVGEAGARCSTRQAL
jgi:hypothetical protein